MSTISPGTRQELVTAVADRYRQSTAAEKRLILDEFVALTGYHRKHAVRVLNGGAITPRARRGRRCVYDAAVTEGLVVLWEASDRMCGKRLKALLPTLVPALEHHGHLSLDPAVRERLLAVSAATIDRRLASARAVTAGQRRRRRSALNGLRSSVPVRTFADWKDPAPGFVEADLVAHCGGTLSGSFVWSLVLTDIASGWTECVPLLVREAHLVVDALDHLRGALPFPLRGIDTDNGSEFLNEVLVAFCREQGDRAHTLQAVSEERPGLGRAEERRRRSPDGRVRPPGGVPRLNVWTCDRCGARVVAPNVPPPSSRDHCPDRPEAGRRPRTAPPAKRPSITDRDGGRRGG